MKSIRKHLNTLMLVGAILSGIGGAVSHFVFFDLAGEVTRLGP